MENGWFWGMQLFVICSGKRHECEVVLGMANLGNARERAILDSHAEGARVVVEMNYG